MLRRIFVAICCVLAWGAPQSAVADQASEIILNQYTVYRASPAARYFTPGSIVMGWPYKGVLRLEMVCRNKTAIDDDPDLLQAPLEQGGFTGTSGWQFDIGIEAVKVLNAAFGGNYVKSVTMKIENAVVYEYSAEDLRRIREKLLQRPDCAEVVKNARYRMRTFNEGTAGLFQNQRFVLASIAYEIDFNKDNPKALSANIQASITKTFQVKFGLTHLKASGSNLTGDNIVIGVYPMWRSFWN
jgi:hypothetical protein